MTVPVGQFCWNELLSTDPEAAKVFLAETLGWSFENFSFGGPAYWVIRSGEAMVGGLGGLDAADIETAESHWLGFVQVDRIDERWERALAAGAIAIRGPHDVPNVGRVCVLRDPTGAPMGWLQDP